MTRSILAVIIGYIAFCVVSTLTRLWWSSPGELSVLASFVTVLGMAGGGYVAAVISRRAPLCHSIAVAILSLIVDLVISHFSGAQHTIRQMTLGMLDSTSHFTWGGLFRVWQIWLSDKSKLSPNTALEATADSASDLPKSDGSAKSQAGGASAFGR